MQFTFIVPLLIILSLMAAIVSAVGLRRPVLVRFYALSSLGLAGLSAYLGWQTGEQHFYIVAIMIAFLKAIIIPAVVVQIAKRCGITEQLAAYLRPAAQFFLISLTLVGIYVFVAASPFAADTDILILFAAVSLVALGLIMLIVRRDIFSQIFGFLTLENGVAVFVIATLNGLPLFAELGVFVAVAIGTFIMASLSYRVHKLHGTVDTALLCELVG